MMQWVQYLYEVAKWRLDNLHVSGVAPCHRVCPAPAATPPPMSQGGRDTLCELWACFNFMIDENW